MVEREPVKFVVAGSSPAPPAPDPYLQRLTALVEKWVKILKLTHWDWTIKIGDEKLEEYASIEIDDDEQEFVVLFRQEALRDSKFSDNYLSCHEVLHLAVFDILPTPQNKTQKKAEERFVRKMSRLLVKWEEALNDS